VLLQAWQGHPDSVLGVIEDISDRKAAELALQRTQRLELLGTLAGGIAHDFNNLLGGVLGYLELALLDCTDNNVRSCIKESIHTQTRAVGLAQQLLTFSRGGSPVRQPGDLPKLLRETALFALSGSNVACEFDLAEDLRPCNFDRTQLALVVENLVVHGKQSMPGGGKIRVVARNVELPNHPALGPGSYVRVSIHEGGPGIPSEELARIFDPFFSAGKHQPGLGLATAYSIVLKHDGFIDAESTPAHGTTFHILLPASPEQPDRAELLGAVEHFGKGTILLVDDQSAILGAVGGMLRRMGYKVLAAHDGSEGLGMLVEARADNVDIAGAILDLTIPGGMGGQQMLVEIRRSEPTLPVFASSGYSDDPVMAKPAEYGFTASLPKPVTRDALASMLNRHLKRGR
jgi:nitrogen-specific signal transduction histidine kinase/ActR/RegA family two-component response regulator